MARKLFLDALLVCGGAAALYSALCALLYLRQDAMIFFPERALVETPAAYGLPYGEHFVSSGEGASICVWHIRRDPGRCIVLCNGNAGNVSYRVDKAAFLAGTGPSVIAFDYRGYGKSTGEPSEKGLYEDLEAVVRFASEKGYPRERTVLYGESIGGAVASHAAASGGFAGLVLESSFTSLEEAAEHHYPFFPVGLLLRSRFPVLGDLEASDCPVLVMHSPDDEIVPFAMGRKLFERARAPKRFFELRGGHNDGGILATHGAKEAIEDFLTEALPPARRAEDPGPTGKAAGVL